MRNAGCAGLTATGSVCSRGDRAHTHVTPPPIAPSAVTRLTLRHVVDSEGLDALLTPRDDILAERRDGDHPPVSGEADTTRRFVLESGPFRSYERVVGVSAGGEVTETFTYELATPPWWSLIFRWPIRRALSRPAGLPPARGGRPSQPWWAPPERLDSRATWTLSMLCTLAIITGYMGTVIGQTLTFAADEFGSSDGDQGILLAAVRIGTVASLAATILADRRGRRPIILVCLLGAVAATIVGATVPGLVWLGVTQTFARGLTTALAVLLGVVAAEELPAGSRAYGASVIAMAAGLGSGMVLWLLPLADLGDSTWRIIYVAPMLGLPLAAWSARRLPETRRFEQSGRKGRPPSGADSDHHHEDRSGDRIDRRRLALLGGAHLLALFFLAPASQFQNEFLRDERGFSGADITVFTLITTTPASLAVFFGGRLADRRGRRPVAAIGMAGAAVFTVVSYLTHGWMVWVSAGLRSCIGGLLVPALGVYGPELFGTRSRARANGTITLLGVAGSASGLLAVGALSNAFGSLGEAFLLAAVAPLTVSLLVLTKFPETTRLELEELNPQDRPLTAEPGVVS